ncbi:hypothetical protein EUGRSUZ_J03157 [Eucalyptus grandis]|uniref:Uncharacterized protein n=2 Tax=Eucalyptus grandis TaxID=71139 RepID=A0ACC3JBW7_EUCGR|nr:hypothetical protein EUGRSUZ_J03157 [Eucalyptus grandis]
MTGLVSPSPCAHVVVFPHMAHGHTLPSIDICNALASLGVKVTIITTPKNAPLILSKFPRVPELPEGCENTADLPSLVLLVPFLKATKSMRPTFESILKEMSEAGSCPLCVISDFFLGWTLDVCQSFAKIGEADMNSAGLIVNSFEELEGDYVAALERFYCQGAKAWCMGPALLYDHNQIERPAGSKQVDPSQSYIKWLDEHFGSGGVIYVSFGTQAHLSDVQMDNIAYGLEMARHPFIWAVKPATWVLPNNGWEDRLKGWGLAVHDWVDQRRILSHPTIGGFLSHCGWNSVLESLSEEVPMLAWPMGAEQPLNAKLVVMGLGAGVMVREGRVGETIASEVIRDGVKELMGGEKGRQARERAREIGRLARQAVEKKGGSSYKNLEVLIKFLKEKVKERV